MEVPSDLQYRLGQILLVVATHETYRLATTSFALEVPLSNNLVANVHFENECRADKSQRVSLSPTQERDLQEYLSRQTQAIAGDIVDAGSNHLSAEHSLQGSHSATLNIEIFQSAHSESPIPLEN